MGKYEYSGKARAAMRGQKSSKWRAVVFVVLAALTIFGIIMIGR